MSDGYFRGPSTKSRRPRSRMLFLLPKGGVMKDFKTYDEQVAILQNRGMIIPDINIAKELLKQNNYYNLINGFKDIFVQPGIHPEVYYKGVTFDELYLLHQFDKELRLNLSQILIVVERTFGSILAHEFSRVCPNHDWDYLDINKYNTSLMTIDPISQISVIEASQLITGNRGLANTLQNAIDNNDPMICHYKTQYNQVPFWVLVNKLSFGTLSKIYKLLQSKERDAIAKSLKEITCIETFADDVQKAINVLVLLRNKCAHDQRIYDFTPGRTTVKRNPFLTTYLAPTDSKNTLFGAISCTLFFLKPLVFNEFCKKIKGLTSNFLSNIHSISPEKILRKTGMPLSFLLS